LGKVHERGHYRDTLSTALPNVRRTGDEQAKRGRMSKRIAMAVSVPWQVSPSQSDLQLTVGEDAATRVSFLANVLRGGTTASTRISLTFQRCRRAVFVTHECSSERGEPDSVDWSSVPPVDLADLDGSRPRFFDAWHASSVCPDPGMYELFDATPSTGLTTQREFMISGHDADLRLQADNWIWEAIDGHLLEAGDSQSV
jgi:hypothetical protein